MDELRKFGGENRVVRLLEPPLLASTGFYSSRSIIYAPVSDYQLSGVQVRKLKQAGIPVELIEPEWARMISETQRETWPD
jgi:hypothetical protein